jgi:hypothetical protein
VSSGERYLAAAYVVVLAVVLTYVAIIALKLARLRRDVEEAARLADDRLLEDEREEVSVGR